MQVATFAFTTALLLAGPQPAPPPQVSAGHYTISDCSVSVLKEVDVPALEPGQLVALEIPELDASGKQVIRDGRPAFQEVREGVRVFKDQVLGQIDDEMEIAQKDVTANRLKMAKKEAENDVSIRYAKAAADVARWDYERAKKANVGFSAVSEGELQRLELADKEARLRVDQATHEFETSGLAVGVSEAEDAVAALRVQRRRIVAPLDGIVVQRYKDVGEWVQTGEPILRIAKIDRVLVQGRARPSEVLPCELQGQQAIVRLRGIAGNPRWAGAAREPLTGHVYFACPIAEEMTEDFRVLVEVENAWVGPDGRRWRATDPSRPRDGYWLLWPGLTAEVQIELRALEGGEPRLTAGRP
jgi:multidrug efflux pump subunit AcrA (membrane-fusion protein)